ncbi:MAG: redox-regulated ATPase YchF [bacterium]
MLKVGIIGLPNVGKSTLFNALTKQAAEVANFPFTTIEPNVGVVPVPDERLDKLAQISKSAKITPTAIEFVDIAGLVKNAHQGEGLGNQFLSHIRKVDAIIHVVRFFEDKKITHVHSKIDPINDAEAIKTELELADLQTTERMTKKETDKEHKIPRLSEKPILYVANLDEQQIMNADEIILPLEPARRIGGKGEREGVVVPLCIKIEQELTELPEDEQLVFLREYNLTATGLNRLITASYQLLNLVTFLTTGPTETRAWTVKKGTRAPQAAGKIHTDLEHGFIRAETVAYKDLVAAGSYADARARGLLRDEGKDYIVQDGDVILFKFAT